MPFFTALTRVSNSLAKHGITMLATVNPLQDDEAYVRSFVSKLSSAVPAFVFVEHISSSGVFSGTVADRENRNPASFTFDTMRTEMEAPEMVSFTVPKHLNGHELFSAVQVNQLKEEQL
jgi:hypothetical protein